MKADTGLHDPEENYNGSDAHDEPGARPAPTDPAPNKSDDRGNPLPSITPPPDPFDPARLRMDQNFGEMAGVKKLLTTVPVRKPSKEVFIRTHSDPAYRLTTCVIDLKEDRGEFYLVDPSLWSTLATEATFGPKLLITTVTRQGVLILWPLRLPGPDGKLDDWSRSALEAAEVARDSWVRVQSNMNLGAYDVVVAAGTAAKPEFPTLSMGAILTIAFKDRFIADTDHLVLRELRGEM